MINIDTDVAMPKKCSRGRPAKYPFNLMEVGDSVFIDGDKTGGRAYMAAQACARSYNKKFMGRNVEGGIRIWRTE